MKKFVVLLVVVAMTCFSAVAFAADVTVGGSYEVRSRSFVNTNAQVSNVDATTAGDQRDTQNRIRIDVNAKAGDVKGKLQLESDFGSGSRDWGTGSDAVNLLGGSGYSTPSTGLGFREAWVNFNLPGLPVNVTGGHQLLSLGNGWFFRSMHFGADAWVVANQTGPNTVAFVNIKVAEGNVAKADDVDAYSVLDVIKLSDAATVGADLTLLKDRRNTVGFSAHPTTIAGVGTATPATDLYNLGVNFNGKLGIVALKAQADMQMGKAKDANLTVNPLITNPLTGAPMGSGDAKFKGNELVIQGAIGLDPVTINFTAARGSGDAEQSSDYKGYRNFLDVDPHYTFLHEYKVTGAAGLHAGFANTTALSAGVSMAAGKSVTIGADFWLLRATKAIAINGAHEMLGLTPVVNPLTGAFVPATSKDLGMEVDVKVNWKLSDNLAWNWTLGIMKPGDAYRRNTAMGLEDADDITGIQGVLAFKF